MPHPDTHDRLVLTNYLAAPQVNFLPHEEIIFVSGVYGDLVYGRYLSIMLQMTYDELRDLMSKEKENTDVTVRILEEGMATYKTDTEIQLPDDHYIRFEKHLLVLGAASMEN